MIRGSEQIATAQPFIQRSEGDFKFREYENYELEELRMRMIRGASKEVGYRRELLMKIVTDLEILMEHGK